MADRFHLLQNLSKALRTLFEQQPQVLKLPVSAAVSEKVEPPTAMPVDQTPIDTA